MSTIEKAIEKLERSKEKLSESGDTAKGNERHANRGISQGHHAVEDNAGPTSIDGAVGESKSSSHRMVKWNTQRLRADGLLLSDDGKNPLAEEYRLIKRPLLVNAFGQGAAAVENGNLIMITSALPGEGKTFTAINLAMSIALERDRTVLLVDSDVAKPSISNYLGKGGQYGLVDYLLSDDMSLSDVLVQTDVPKLRLLPAGRTHPHSTELLASENMRRLTQELSNRYPDRVVIFDSPPLLATSEAAVLASHMGQIAIVVEAERTTQEVIGEAMALLDPGPMTGLVLNKTRQSFGSRYYDYYRE